MSYEGYVQILCSNGHDHICDCYEWDFGGFGGEEENWKCSICGSGVAWTNNVDTTNGSFCSCATEDGYVEGASCEYCDKGRIDGYVDLEIETEAVTCKCDCGHVHVVEVATYKIPKGG